MRHGIDKRVSNLIISMLISLFKLPTAGSGSADKMDQLCSARLSLGLFDGNAS